MMDNRAGEPGQVMDNLRLISDQVDRASKIINQMRELARRSEQHFTTLDVNGVIRESVEFLTSQMQLSEVEIALDLEEDLPEVLGDWIRLEQVFLNLLANARQAMEGSAVRRLAVSSRREAGSIVVEVRDTGRGFAKEDAERLFTPFYTTKKPGEGTGLGLSISLRIIQDHGGTLKAQGRPGRGAAFTIRLPVSGEAEEDAAEKGE
jgi:histidine kinase